MGSAVPVLEILALSTLAILCIFLGAQSCCMNHIKGKIAPGEEQQGSSQKHRRDGATAAAS